MIISVPLNRIKPNPWQTRIAEPGSEHIKDLALDIARNGLLQTPVGRLVNSEGSIISNPGWGAITLEGYFQEGKKDLAVQLAFGHNRLAAYMWLEDVKDSSNLEGDWSSMPVEVRDLTDEQMANLAWSENEKRRDVTPIERARAIQKRLEDFKWTHRQAAEALGIDHSTIGNILRLLKLPEEWQAALQAGEITERQATAVLVLFELPEFEEGSGYWDKKKDIISAALNGESSDRLRGKVENYLNNYGKLLGKAEFGRNFAIPEVGGVYCGTCETCDKRFKNRNLCFLQECFEAKTKFVRIQYLKEASFLSGYGILDPDKGGNPSQFFRYDEQLEKIKAVKCPNMVLDYTIDESTDIPAYPHARLVCEKRNNSCSCLAGLHASVTNLPAPKVAEIENVADEPDYVDAPEGLMDEHLEAWMGKEAPAAPSAKDLEEAARQARRDKKEAVERREEIQELVEERLVQALREQLPGIFYLIAHRSTFVFLGTRLDLEECYRTIAHSLTAYPLVPSQSDSLAEMIEQINEGLARLRLEPISLEKGLVEVFEADEVEE